MKQPSREEILLNRKRIEAERKLVDLLFFLSYLKVHYDPRSMVVRADEYERYAKRRVT